MTTVQVLRKARALIRKGWTQGSEARNANGDGVVSSSADAVRWCLMGSIMRTALRNFHLRDRAYQALDTKGSVVEWNDRPGRKKADVLRLFDRAIKRAAK